MLIQNLCFELSRFILPYEPYVLLRRVGASLLGVSIFT
jgi:hypothetical protein